jgi:segregation and condensation protein B
MFGPWLRRAFQTPVEARLSAPAMETLAVVAYRQPILRAEIESIRGVQCGDILRQLMDRDLIRIIGRSEDLGRPLVYGTTKRFLEVFGLRHLDELPRADQFRGATSSTVTQEKQADPLQKNDPGAGRDNDHSTPVHSPEEESVSTRIRPAKFNEDFLEEAALALADGPSSPYSLAILESERAAAEEEDDDEEWEDDDDEDEDDDEEEEEDDFVDDEWEEVEDDDEEEEEDEEEDEEWEDDDEDDDWDDDDDEDEEEWEDDEE